MPLNAPTQQEDGKWRVTVRTGVGYGYCKTYVAPSVDPNFSEDPAVQAAYAAEVAATNLAYAPWVSAHHSGGHVTAEEARLCARTFAFDQKLKLDVPVTDLGMANIGSACSSCSAVTTRVAALSGIAFFRLCPTHMTKEQVETLYP